MNITKGKEGLELLNKMLNHAYKLYNLSKLDETIFGNSFVEFTDNSMRVINPKDISLTSYDNYTEKKGVKRINGRTKTKLR